MQVKIYKFMYFNSEKHISHDIVLTNNQPKSNNP